AMATASVARAGPSVTDRAKRNSFQQYTNVMIAVVASPGHDSDHYVRVLLERVPLCPVVHARAGAADGAGRHRAVPRAVPGAVGADPGRRGAGDGAGRPAGVNLSAAHRGRADGGSSKGVSDGRDPARQSRQTVPPP